MIRRIFVVLLISFLMPTACSRPDEATANKAADEAGQPVDGDWAIVRFEAEPDTLNPLTQTATNSQYTMYGVNNSQIYEFLLGYNPKDWTLTQPILAEAMPTISDDHLTYTFVLRDGVKWHDGQPMTPEDVLFTFKATACPLTDAAPARSYMTDLADIVMDGRTMKFLMKKPNSFNVINIGNTIPVMPKHVFDPEGFIDGLSYKDMLGPKGKDAGAKKFADQFNSHPANRAPVGTGPYKFEKWDTGRELVLARNENYWGAKKPHLDKILYRFITDYTAGLTALKAGDVDAMPRLTPIQFAQQTGGAAFDQQFTKTRYPVPAVFYIMWNNERPFFKDKRVRQAMTLLLDRQKILETIRFGLGKIAIGAILPGNSDFNPNIKSWPYDPKRAAELLDEAGWKDHDGDGIRDKDGVKFQFEFLGANGSTIYPQLAPIMREELKKAGIDMTERVIEFNVMLQSLKDHKFDASTLGTTSDLVQDPYQSWHSSSALNRGSNYGNFKNPEADKLLEDARREFDLEKRKQLYWRWQEIIHDEQPYTFMYYAEEAAAYSKRFQNVQWLPPRPGYDLQAWWVPKAQQKHGKPSTR